MSNNKCFGIYRGTVFSNKDPLDKRRLRLLVPAVTGTEATNWAWSLETASVKVSSPAVGQGVWVMFENGDPSFPIWSGTFGKVIDAKKHVLIAPSTVTGEYLIEATFSDSKKELDLVATLLHMSATLEDFESRISNVEANKSDVGHTHPGL